MYFYLLKKHRKKHGQSLIINYTQNVSQKDTTKTSATNVLMTNKD